VPQSNKQEKGLWARGVVLSFDFVTQDLRDNFSNSSPQGAYDVIKAYLVKNGFEHLKDTDYKHDSINKFTVNTAALHKAAVLTVSVDDSVNGKLYPIWLRI